MLASCSCGQVSRTAVRHASTKAAPKASTSAAPSSQSSRIVASALLSRAPLVLPRLSAFEQAYYAYQQKIHRALAKPVSVSTSWFFKSGSAAEKSFVAFNTKLDKETGAEDPRRAYEIAADEVEGAAKVDASENAADASGDLHSLERKMDRTLYLLLKKNRKDHAWQFPQGGVEAGESLVEAARRELGEETGPDMDVWSIGRAPAGAYAYSFPKEHIKKTKAEHDGAKVFFMPMRIIRGQAKPNKSEGLVDFAWLTKEEIKDKVAADYWQAVEPMLSDN